MSIDKLTERMEKSGHYSVTLDTKGLFVIRYAAIAEYMEELLRAKSACFKGIPDPEKLVSMMYDIRGCLKGNINRHEDAIIDLDKAIELDPKNALAYNNRAAAKRWVGRREESIEDYRTAVTLFQQIPEENLEETDIKQIIIATEQLTWLGEDFLEMHDHYQALAKKRGININPWDAY